MNLVERTTALVPMLREHAAAAEKERKVPRATLEALDKAGVFRMLAPKKFGGDEASFETQALVLAEVARGCPSTSWVATIYSAMAWTAAAFPDQAQEEIFAGGVPRIAGVFSPTGSAVRQADGFVLNGRWPYNTGCHGAEWTLVVALEKPEGGDPLPYCCLVRSRELTILDDWYASGMAGTGSNTVVAENVFVPARRALPLPDMVEGRYPERHNSGNPYFNYPLAQVLVVNGGGTPLGIARGALEAFFERLPGRGIMYTTYADKSAAPVTHLQVGEASLKIDSAIAHVRMAAAVLDGPDVLRGRALTLAERVRSRAHVGYATGLAREAVDLLFYSSGASSIQSSVPMQRFQRDMQALANHAVMHAPTAVELYGRVLCGLEPNTPLF